VALLCLAQPAVAAPRAFHVVFTIRDPRVDEASGIALGVVSPGVAYIQNDSGDTNRFFAVDARTGSTAATITVRGARNVDWEDIAVAPSPSGVPSVWLADIGDNDATRGEVEVYRVAEPTVRASARDVSITTRRADVWRLSYPTGPVNAESFAVTPTGVGYLVTKSVSGRSVVYQLPPRPDRHAVQQLTRVAPVRFTSPLSFGRLATGATISADGRWLAIRTYLAAYLWPLPGGGVAAALAHRGRDVHLPLELQGEGIAFGGDRIYIDSEGRHGPVYALRYPALAPRPPSSSSAPPPSAPPSATSGTTASPPIRAHSTAARGDSSNRHPGWVGEWVVAIGAIAVLGAAVEYRRRRGGTGNFRA
jgi:hypothetical protein